MQNAGCTCGTSAHVRHIIKNRAALHRPEREDLVSFVFLIAYGVSATRFFDCLSLCIRLGLDYFAISCLAYIDYSCHSFVSFLSFVVFLYIYYTIFFYICQLYILYKDEEIFLCNFYSFYFSVNIHFIIPLT